MRIFLKIFLLVLFVTKTALAQNNEVQKPLIITSISPIYQIIFAVTYDKSNNVLISNPSISEHEYNLKKTDIATVKKADLIFYVNDNLEKNFAKLIVSQNMKSHAFELTKIKDLKILYKKNDPKNIDEHVWLNPQNALKIAEFVARKVSEIDPKNSAQYYKNLENFRKEVGYVEKQIRSQLSKNKSPNYIFFHDGYQYFENYFAISSLKTIAFSHDQDLSISDLREIDVLAKQGEIKCVIGEKWDEKNTAQKLAKKYQINFVKLDVASGKNYPDLLLQVKTAITDCK